MKSYYKLEDIYYNYLINFESLYLDKYIKQLFLKYNNYIKTNNFYYGLVNDKIQFYCNCISNDKNNKYTLVYYFSNKYNEYKTVLLKQFDYNILINKNDNSNYINGIYIYGKKLLSNVSVIENNPPAFNVEWLDIYYDTIFTLNEFLYYNNNDYNNKMYYDKFGNDISGLITLPIEDEFNSYYNYVDTYNLYNNDGNTLKENKYTINTLLSTEDNIVNEDTLTYNFEKLVYNYNYPNSLSTHHIYIGIENIYNYISENDITNVDYDILSINNEYSIIAGIKNQIIGQGYNVSYMNYNYSYDNSNINNINKLYSTQYSKYIKLETSITQTYKNVLGEKVFNDLEYIFKFIDSQIVNNDTGINTYVNKLNIGEYLNIISIYNQLNAYNIKNTAENSDLAIDDIQLDVTTGNILNISTFRLLSNNVYFRTDVNNNFIISISDILDSILVDSVKISHPYYTKSTNVIYEIEAIDYTSINTQHSGEILDKKLINSTVNSSDFTNIILKEEIDFIGTYDNLNDFSYLLNLTGNISELLINNTFLDSNRFKIYGAAIDIDNSDTNYLSKVTNYYTLKKYIESYKINIMPYPVPMILDNLSNMNINTNSAITHINDYFNLDSVSSNIINDSTVYNITTYKENVSNYVNNISTLDEYDKTVYNLYNENSLIYNFYDLTLMNKNYMNYIYLIYDKYTDNYDVINIFDLIGIDYHKNKIEFDYNKYIKNTIKFYDTNPAAKNLTVSGYVNLTSGYTINNKPIYYNKLEILNGNNLIGYIEKVVIDCKIYNTLSYEIINTEVLLDYSDFTKEGNNLVYLFSDILSANEEIVDDLTYNVYVNMSYQTFTYFNNFNVKFYTNFNNFISTTQVILTGYYYSDTITELISDTKINIFNSKINNIIPQIVYSKNISLELFDINDDIQKYYTDNKKCIIFNNYINNITENYNVNDSTFIDFSDISVFYKSANVYNNFTNKNNILPYIVNDNINRYIKVYIKLSVSENSDLVESFQYTNLYDVNLVDDSKGVLILDGKITDYTNDITTIDDLLKEYKINLSFSISNNVNNNINIPVNAVITYELYNSYNDYMNNIILSTETNDDLLLLDVKNRGNYISSELTYSPKFLDYIEYFDIYPQYIQQKEILHTVSLEFSLSSLESSPVKISEIYFNIFNCTDDLYVAIPNNYENIDNPENEINDIEQSNYKPTIIAYINYLIRYKCNNCTNVNIKLNVRNKPKYYGFNIASLLLGCYEYNIKLEQFIPYLFYKESANTVFIIDKKTTIEKTKVELSSIIKSDYWDNLDLSTQQYYDNFSGNYDKSDLVNYIDKPIKSKNTLMIFNSSFNNKKIIFNLSENNSPKTILNTHKEYNIAPLEFKIVSLIEEIDTTSYVDTYDSGIAFYDVIEYDYYYDNTTVIDEAELPIPSMDDYIRSILNFIDKTVKIVKIDYDQNNLYIDESEQSNKYKSENSIASTKITVSRASDLNVEYTELKDIDYLFYVNETYNVIIDKSNLSNMLSWITQFGKIIYIKVPLIYPKKSNYIINTIDDLDYNEEDNTTFIEVNNTIDLNTDYLYLVGNQVNIDQYKFTLTGIISIKNETLLSYILNNDYNLDNFVEYGISLNFKIINPTTILSLFFKDYGDDAAINVANIFVGKDKNISNDNINILSTLLDSIAIDNIPKIKSATNTISLIGKSYNNRITSVELEKINNLEDNGELEIYNSDLNGIYDNSFIFSSIKKNTGLDRFLNSLNYYLNIENYTFLQDDINYDNQVFDDVNAVLSDNNFLTNVFNSNGFFKTNIKLSKNNGLKTNHYFSLSCDGGYDNIISSSITNNDSSFEIYFKGDNNVLLNNDNNYLSIVFENLKQYTLNLIIDNDKYNLNNSPYSLFNSLQKKILQTPLYIKTIDYNKYPINIISDTNYKMIFDIPVEVFKATQSYLVIDKIRIADNFINDTDYCIIFGDNNEIYTVKSNNEKIIKKTYYKYDKNNLKFLIKGFNIPNQTGSFYTTIIIYYTFNGESYTLTKDIAYNVILPEVLDNEYLIVNVERLDYVKNPVNKTTDNFGNIITEDIVDSVNSIALDILTNVNKGTAGCDTTYPDLNWFK